MTKADMPNQSPSAQVRSLGHGPMDEPANPDTRKQGGGATWLSDLVAGITVAVVELPQAMAYAVIAGVPPVYGIYTSVIQGFIGSLLCANRHVRTGPTNTQSLLVASVMATQGRMGPAEYVAVLAALTFIKGFIQIFAGVLRAGMLFRYVSPSTVMGISAGAGVLIIAGQLPAMVGMTRGDDHGLPGLVGLIAAVAGAPKLYDPRTLALGVGTIVLMLGLARIHRLVPAALIAVAASCAVVAMLDWGAQISTVGRIPQLWPELIWPMGAMSEPGRWTGLIPGAIALAVLGMVEAVAIGRSLVDPSNENPGTKGANRELFAQGIANFVSSFVGAIPGSASFSRSMLDRTAGAVTRASGPIGALMVALLAIALAPACRFLPLATLAGILIVVAVRLINVGYFRTLGRLHRADFVVCMVTALATVLLPLQYAVFVGVGLNLALQLRVASRLRAYELSPRRHGGFVESPIEDASNSQQIRIVQLDGNLFFALSDDVDALLRRLEKSEARVVILRLRNTQSIDASVADAIVSFVGRMQQGGRHVLLCGLRGTTLAIFRGKLASFGRDDSILFVGADELLQSLGQAMNEAHRLLDLPRALDSEWVYVI